MISLSIITITKNDEDGFYKTLSSIPSKYKNRFEYIVVNGGKPLKKNLLNAKVDFYLEENDSGISDAFNKGINLAKGRYILLLNSGDTLVSDNTFRLALGKLFNDESIICYGVCNEKTGFNIPNRKSSADEIPHQGMFVAREIYKKIGGYSNSFKLRMDYEFLRRAFNKKISFIYIEDTISFYSDGGISSSPVNRLLFYREAVSIDILYDGYPSFRNLIRFIYWAVKNYFSFK
jgi:glycosyltransferase involved in cell wall biosynthesis